MKQVATYVTKKTGSDQLLLHNTQPLGGTYVRLETEWKEMLKQRHSQHNMQASNNAISLGAFAGTGGGGGGGGQLGSSSSSNQNFYGGGTSSIAGGAAGGVGAGGMACGPGMLSMSKQKHKY